MKNTGDPDLINVKSKIDTGNKKRTKSYGRKNILEKERGKDLFGGEKDIFKEKTKKKKKKSSKKSLKNNEEEKSDLLTSPYTMNNYSDLNSRTPNEENLNLNSNNINSNNSNPNIINNNNNINNSNKALINNNNNNNNFVDYSSNIINEKKTKDSLKRLISSSNDLLNQQNNILSQCDEFAKTVSLNEFEIERMKLRQETDNFPEVIKNYTKNLSNILEKLRKTSKEIDESRKLREENNNLKYKIQMLSIDKNDDYLNIESKLTSARNVYANEINSMINFFHEIGLDNNPMEKVSALNFSEDKIINFFSLVKKHMKDMKSKIDSQDELIIGLKKENGKILQKIDNIKLNSEAFIKRKNIDFEEVPNSNFNISNNNKFNNSNNNNYTSNNNNFNISEGNNNYNVGDSNYNYDTFNNESNQFNNNNLNNDIITNINPSTIKNLKSNNLSNYEETKKLFPNNNFNKNLNSNNNNLPISTNYNSNYDSKINDPEQYTYNYSYNPTQSGIGESQHFISNMNTNKLINDDNNNFSTQNLLKSNSANFMKTNFGGVTSQKINESSFIDNFKRSKDLRYDYDPNNLNLEHKYTDSYFYSSNDNYPKNTNTSQPMPKFN